MRENGDDAGASKVVAAEADAQSGSSEEGPKFPSAFASLGQSLPALIRTLILATLLVIASPYFSRRICKRAREGMPSSDPLKGALEINRRCGADQRWIDRLDRERRAKRLFVHRSRIAGRDGSWRA